MRVDIPLMNGNLSKKSSIRIPYNPCELSSKPWNKWKSRSMNLVMSTMFKQSFCNRVRLREVVYHLKLALQLKVYGVTEEFKNVSDGVANTNSTIQLNSTYPPPCEEEDD